MVKYRELPSDKIGMMPGSAVYVGELPPEPTRVTLHIFNKGAYEHLDAYDFPTLQKAIANGFQIWIDIRGLEDSPLIAKLGQDFGLHPLLVEDIVNTHQRAKIDVYDNTLYFVFQLLDNADLELNYTTEQFSMVVLPNVLMTFRESEDYSFQSLYKKLRSQVSLLRESNMDYLAYLIIDSIVDDYFSYVENVGYTLEEMEDSLISTPDIIEPKTLYRLKRRILTLGRTIAPLRDMIHLLLSDQSMLIEPKYMLYFRDLHDHCLRLLQQIDLHREMTLGLFDIYLSTINNRMNETMKILTLFASIFIPLTFIAGIYGMNFKNMPELDWHYGYPLVMGFMASIAGTMLWYFKRKKLI